MPRLRGEAFGRAHADRVRHTVEVYRRMCDLSAGSRVRASDDEHDELQGIADGAGVDVRELLAVNARTELTSRAARVLGRRRTATCSPRTGTGTRTCGSRPCSGSCARTAAGSRR